LSLGTFIFNGVRFMLGVLALSPLVWRGRAALRGWGWRELGAVGLAGLLMFLGITLQQEGLRYTTAANAGFITGLYVVIIPLLLALVWRKPPPTLTWGATLAAMAGLFLLSTGGALRLAFGDLIELGCAFVWALHVLYLGWIVRRLDALHVAVGQNLVCSVLSLALGAFAPVEAWQALPGAWLPLVYTGVLSVGIGYALQAQAQRVAPAADAAIIMSLEAIFAALGGWLLLNETLAPLQILGCLLMLAGMVLVQARSYAIR
jgi:drug/metabolite transporter (DMT)-like permease